MKNNQRIFILLVLATFISCNLTTSKVEVKMNEVDTALIRQISAKYIIENIHGSGYILLNHDNTYEHVFIGTDSSYLDRGVWDVIDNRTMSQDMPFGGAESNAAYDIVLKDWYWRYAVDGKTDPHVRMNEILQFQNDRLRCYNVAVTNPQVEFLKESVYSKTKSQYRFIPKDTIFITGNNCIDAKVELGQISIDSIVYDVQSIYRKIEIADGFKGRNFLIFRNDSLHIDKTFEADQPSDLPIDVFENALVFMRQDGLFCFDYVFELNDLICFDCKDCFEISTVRYHTKIEFL